MELPNDLSPSSFLLVKSKAWDKVQGFWFETSYYKPFFGFLWEHCYHNKISKNYTLIYINLFQYVKKNILKELTFNNVAIKSLSFWNSFAKVIHIFGKTKFLMLKNLNANYFKLREWKESNLHLQISHINWNRTNDFTDNLHSIMRFDLQFTLYTVCCLTFQLHSQNYFFNFEQKCWIEQLLGQGFAHALPSCSLRIWN